MWVWARLREDRDRDLDRDRARDLSITDSDDSVLGKAIGTGLSWNGEAFLGDDEAEEEEQPAAVVIDVFVFILGRFSPPLGSVDRLAEVLFLSNSIGFCTFNLHESERKWNKRTEKTRLTNEGFKQYRAGKWIYERF